MKVEKNREIALETLANEIRKFLLERDMWQDVRIFFNGKAYCSCPFYQHQDGSLSEDYRPGSKNINYNNPDFLRVIENVNPLDYTQYADPSTITMTFEGPLYEALNYGTYGWKTEEEFSNLIKKYGYYYELGESWNLTLNPVGI